MKKYLPAIGVLVMSCVTTAHAQSSVTLYGIVDTGIAYIHNVNGASSLWRQQTSNLSGSEWGLKGREDLGGGLAAIFQLENGFDVATGEAAQSSRLFGRQSFVGLASDVAGTFTLGRQYDPISDLLQPITADAFSGWFATPGDVDNYDSDARFNNSVKWTSPGWGGFQGALMYSFGGVAGATGSGATYSAALLWTAGNLSLAGGYLHIDNGNAVLGDRGTSSADTLFNTPVNAAYASARSIGIARLAAQYTIERLTAGVGYSYSLYAPDASSSFTVSEKYHNGSVFLSYQFTPAFQIVGGYNYTRTTGDSAATYHQANLGIDYSLSKRTDVYASAGYQHASGENGSGVAEASIGSFGYSAGKSTQEYALVGVRHRF
ncbi:MULTISPECIES: porin [unclassified Paraburkholderia]|uniref:porin n=1 Tax=unclassified Paraburkholderia TaxID=2615204 RepID=UPI002AB12CB6|nr:MULTISPECIES: porin [unclassified Paraburkholderia]